MQNPFFSVILPTYNRANLISDAINSLISQSFKNWELIVINDASTDETEKVVLNIKDERIRYFKNEKNLEKSGARNRGIENANGLYICFLDDDDLYEQNFLEEFYKKIELENFAKAMYYCECLFENEIGYRWNPDSQPNVDFVNNHELVLQRTIASQRVVLHKEILIKHKYDPENYRTEDLDLWLRVLEDYPIFWINKHLYVFKVHGNRSVSLKNGHTWNFRYNYIKNLVTKSIFKKYFRKKIANKTYGYAALCLSRHYTLVENNKKALFHAFESLYVSPFNHTKEKLFLLIFNCKVTKLFLNLYRGNKMPNYE